MNIEGVIWKLVTGHSMFGIPSIIGAELIILSAMTIPFVILRGVK